MLFKLLAITGFYLALTGISACHLYASDIYKYKDENGQWVFTDQEPLSEAAETIQVPTSGQASPQPVVLAEQIDGNNVLRVRNPLPGDIQAEVTASAFADQPRRQVVPAGATVTLYRGRAAIPSFTFQWVLGNPASRQDNHQYQLPLPANRSYRVSQAFNGRFSHAQQPSTYAVDFEMPVGTDIMAARAGTVVLITEDYSFGGQSDYFLDKANHVMVLHGDGTYAIYAHILQGSAALNVGDSVVAGQRIARSGSSGYSTGPHLHFAVLKNINFESLSVPFRFVDDKGNSFVPVAGMQLARRQ